MNNRQRKRTQPSFGTNGTVFLGLLVVVALAILTWALVWQSNIQRSANVNQNLIANLYSAQTINHGGNSILFGNCTGSPTPNVGLCANQTASAKIFYYVCEDTGNVYECDNHIWVYIENFGSGGGVAGGTGPMGLTGATGSSGATGSTGKVLVFIVNKK